MKKIKTTKKYYFTVEGETEKWYLEWLQEKINNYELATSKVSFDVKVQKKPLKRVKTLINTNKITITHFFDYESNDEVHVKQFESTLDAMKKSMLLGKQVKYELGYSNFSFELWIILHEAEANSSIADRKNYLALINKSYGEKFESLHEYKHENEFKRLLNKLSLSHVKNAVINSKKIMENNSANNFILYSYKGYKYYKENPSLSVWEVIEKILKECGCNN